MHMRTRDVRARAARAPAHVSRGASDSPCARIPKKKWQVVGQLEVEPREVGERAGLGRGRWARAGLAEMSLANASLPKSISKQAPEVLPRASRARRFGIDCESELRWHAKEPGGDYKQKLLMKNVSNQVLRVVGNARRAVLLCPPRACSRLRARLRRRASTGVTTGPGHGVRALRISGRYHRGRAGGESERLGLCRPTDR